MHSAWLTAHADRYESKYLCTPPSRLFDRWEQPARALCRSNARLHHTGNSAATCFVISPQKTFCGGNCRHELYYRPCQFGPRQSSSPAGFEPAFVDTK